ncbi:MAG TPA: hypothetical protein VN950_19110 [Terriglobales bacterium]|jgi:hypothetical protein|nr:hypothetical protein [Terriglobales bacterium]
MSDEQSLKFEESILRLRLRLMKTTRLHRNQVKYSCQWANDEEFQNLLDYIVAQGIATREIGSYGGEWYRSVSRG